MGWNGQQIRTRTKEMGTTLTQLAATLQVSRVALNNWIGGQVPRGASLLGLCRALGVSADYFFSPSPLTVSVPLHRTKGRSRIDKPMQDAAQALVAEYRLLFQSAPEPGLVPVLRLETRSESSAASMARAFRELSGVAENEPLDYVHLFTLLDKLGIVVVFRTFPKTIKGYAFYCKIGVHRVVFVNTQTHILDLIFPLVHEAVHAVRDERSDAYDAEEERFCDMVANRAQFPEGYVATIARMLADKSMPERIVHLKRIGGQKHHAIFGIAQRLEAVNLHLPPDAIGGANTNLKKEYKKTIGDMLFRGEDPVSYIEFLSEYSPRFLSILVDALPSSTERTFGTWIDLENPLDASLAARALRSKMSIDA